jgi:Fe2+ transport system protein B
MINETEREIKLAVELFKTDYPVIYEIISLHQKQINQLKSEIAELKKQLPMTITEEPFDADPGKSTDDYTNNKPKVEYTTEGAPVWEVWFQVNTSEGITERIVEINAWSEKQAIYLGRTEKLFHDMSKMVKIKQIQPKWNILDAVATKKD